jgi:homoserine O-acetyltransferase
MLVVSYSSDWLYPPKESEDMVRALLQNGVDTTYVKLETTKGHDAFLLEDKKLENLTRNFLARVAGR